MSANPSAGLRLSPLHRSTAAISISHHARTCYGVHTQVGLNLSPVFGCGSQSTRYSVFLPAFFSSNILNTGQVSGPSELNRSGRSCCSVQGTSRSEYTMSVSIDFLRFADLYSTISDFLRDGFFIVLRVGEREYWKSSSSARKSWPVKVGRKQTCAGKRKKTLREASRVDCLWGVAARPSGPQGALWGNLAEQLFAGLP